MIRQLLILFLASTFALMGSCGGDNGAGPTDGNGNGDGDYDLSFEQASYLGCNFGDQGCYFQISAALDGITLYTQFRGKFFQAASPGAVGVEVEIDSTVKMNSVSSDGQKGVAVRSDSYLDPPNYDSNYTLEIWTRSSGTDWAKSQEVFVSPSGHEYSIRDAKFSKDGSKIVASYGLPFGPTNPTTVLVTWSREGGSWFGPDTLQHVGGAPILGFIDPCWSDDSLYLFAAQGTAEGYKIHLFKKQADGSWQELGPLGSEVNIPGIEEIYCPFFAFDASYLYFGAYGHDGNEQNGIYRAKILKSP